MRRADRESLSDRLTDVAKRLEDDGLLFRGHHANLSARLDDGHILLSGRGSVRDLSREDFAVVAITGEVVEGRLDPTLQEVVAMHTGVYRAKPGVGAVIHAHPPYATAFAVAGTALPIAYEPLVRFGVTGPIPVVGWAPRGSAASVAGIVQALSSDGRPAVLLANHGVLACEETPERAADLLATLDEAAFLVWAARGLGGEHELPATAFAAVRERMEAFGSRAVPV